MTSRGYSTAAGGGRRNRPGPFSVGLGGAPVGSPGPHQARVVATDLGACVVPRSGERALDRFLRLRMRRVGGVVLEHDGSGLEIREAGVRQDLPFGALDVDFQEVDLPEQRKYVPALDLPALRVDQSRALDVGKGAASALQLLLERVVGCRHPPVM